MLGVYVGVYALCATGVVWVCAGEASLCQSAAYRGLSATVQNEHQCLVMDRLQQDTQALRGQADTHFSAVLSRLSKIEHKLTRRMRVSKSRSIVNAGTGYPTLKGVPVARDCHELYMSGVLVSGVYAVKLPSGLVLNVYCDMDSYGGGWTRIQHRHDGSLDFHRKWDEYAFGFGNVNSEHWLGNENLHSLTAATNYTLHVDLWDWEGEHAYAEYSFMQVAGEKDDYRLQIGHYNGTAGDSLSYHNHMRFTTRDRDHDRWWANCGRKDRAGWWFNACSRCLLNGVYALRDEDGISGGAPPDGTHTGITWFHWRERSGYSLPRVTMMLKPRAAILLEQGLELGLGPKIQPL